MITTRTVAQRSSRTALDTVPARSSEAYYRTLFDSTDTGFCIVKMGFDAVGNPVDYRFIDANAAFERQTGLVDAVGHWVSELAPDLERHWFERYGRVALTGESARFEHAAESLGRYYDVQAIRVGDPEDALVAVMFEDIAERRAAQLALERSEAHWHGLFERLREGLIVGEVIRDQTGKVTDWRYVEVNLAWGELVDLPPLAAKGKSVREVFPGIEDAWVEEIAEVVETGISALFTRQVGALGRWYEGRAHRLDSDRFAIIFLEITARRAAETRRIALIELGDRLRDLQDLAAMSAVAAEITGRALGVERAGYGTVAEDGRTVIVDSDWTPPGSPSAVGRHDLSKLGTFVDQLQRGQSVAIQDTHTDHRTITGKDGLDRLSVRALLNFPVIENGRLVALLFANAAKPRAWTREEMEFAREVAERTRSAIERRRAESELRALNAALEQMVADRTAELLEAEEQLRQSQKMEAVGQLTGGLAHDFNNLLGGISGSLQMVQSRVAQGRTADVERYIDAAQSSAKRAAALTHRLLAFSRRQQLSPIAIDVNRLVADFEEMVRRTVGPQITLEVVAAIGLWTTLVDPNQLENAILNLCINARDAMPEGGKLTIETANRWLDARTARQRDVASGQYISLCVSDNGTGMPPEVVERAFDPFYTTKPTGQGTGLGLSMIYGFARQSDGQVRIYSEIDQGTTVCIYLPRHHGESGALREPVEKEAEAPHAEAGETVLVVDDNPIILMLVTDALKELGYTAIEAVDGPGGLQIVESGVRIDLLISDVGLPGSMNGRQLAAAARVVRPGLQVLFITGYAENAVLNHGHLEPGMQVLTKPFTMETLGSRIRSMLGAG